MITLTPYQEEYRSNTLKRIGAFWGFHRDLVNKTEQQDSEEENSSLLQDLKNWTSEDHWLFVILQDGADVGFVHLQKIGPIVMQLEDIFVQPPLRGRGIATAAIAQAEALCRQMPGIEAVTLQVVPRNEAALRLYHKLGYDTLSLVTLRKELGPNPRRRRLRLRGLTFRF